MLIVLKGGQVLVVSSSSLIKFKSITLVITTLPRAPLLLICITKSFLLPPPPIQRRKGCCPLLLLNVIYSITSLTREGNRFSVSDSHNTTTSHSLLHYFSLPQFFFKSSGLGIILTFFSPDTPTISPISDENQHQGKLKSTEEAQETHDWS